MKEFIKNSVAYQVIRSIKYYVQYVGKDVYPIKVKRVDGKKNVHIVASGPSINESLESIDVLNEFYMMNGLASSEYLEKYKPSTFFLFDPFYFDFPMTEVAQSTWNDLNERVKWEMELVVPYRYQKPAHDFLCNQNIELRCVRDVPMMTESYKTDFFFYRKNIAIPPVGSVAMYAIYWAIQSGAKAIYVHGVDYSYRFVVDRENRVWHVYSYADGRKACRETKKYESGNLWRAYSVIASELRIFKRLDMYAKSLGIEIINMSPASCVDAFKKQ